MADQMTEHDEELQRAFAQFDKDDDGLIDFEEFRLLLRVIGSHMSLEDLKIGFAFIDEDDSGKINLAELAKWWEVVRSEAEDAE